MRATPRHSHAGERRQEAHLRPEVLDAVQVAEVDPLPVGRRAAVVILLRAQPTVSIRKLCGLA